MATFFAVPLGTPAAVCKAGSCHKRIFWVTTGRGSHMPVDCDVPGGKVPTRTDPGQGVPHWNTCPERTTLQKAMS